MTVRIDHSSIYSGSQIDVGRCYTAAFDSVAAIDTLIAKPLKQGMEAELIEVNVAHLETILTYGVWDTEDLTPFREAVVRGRDWLARQ